MLAPVVFEAAAGGDARVMEIIEEGARVLCEYTEAVATPIACSLRRKLCFSGGSVSAGLNLQSRLSTSLKESSSGCTRGQFGARAGDRLGLARG